jgi:hypothetical protein
MKQFVRTANFEYINLDFVKSIVYKKIKDKELFEIVLECVDGEVSLGFVFEENMAIDIIQEIIEGESGITGYLTYEEVLEELQGE